MSSRHTRRLQENLAAKRKDEVNEEEEEEYVPKPKPAFSNFMDSSSDDEDEDKPVAAAPPPPPPTNSKSSKKNKKSAKQLEEEAEDAFLNTTAAAAAAAAVATAVTPPPKATTRFKFSLDHLNPDEEVKRKLGKALFRSNNTSSKKKPANNNSKRKFYLVTPERDWPMPPTFFAGEGCRMVKCESTGKYTLEASEAYQTSQVLYEHCVASFDPNQLIELVSLHPFQIDTLLQLFDFFQSRQQNEYAVQMLHRALFALEAWCGTVFCSQFGNVQLKNFSGLNGSFMRALDLSMRLASRRDCYETAFALSLLIQSLSTSPTFAMLHCDYFALRSGNLEWSAEEHVDVELENVPAAAYGKALALLQLKQSTRADAALRVAMHRFPKFASCVLDGKVDDEGDAAEYEPRLSLQAFIRQESLWTNAEVAAWMRNVQQQQVQSVEDTVPQLDLRKFLSMCKLVELTDKINLLPAEMLQQEQDEDEFFNQVQEEFVQEQQQQQPEAAANVDVQNNNLLLFLQTLLPWARLPGNTEE